jgi:hypothetical protein
MAMNSMKHIVYNFLILQSRIVKKQLHTVDARKIYYERAKKQLPRLRKKDLGKIHIFG